MCQFADSRTRNIRKLRLTIKQNRFYATETAVEFRLCLFVLKVADRADTLDNKLGSDLLCKVHRQSAKDFYADAWLITVYLPNGSDTLFGRTHRRLVDIVCDNTNY